LPIATCFGSSAPTGLSCTFTFSVDPDPVVMSQASGDGTFLTSTGALSPALLEGLSQNAVGDILMKVKGR